jgi:hypothetical protein
MIAMAMTKSNDQAHGHVLDRVSPILARRRPRPRPQGTSLQQVRRRPVSQCPGHQESKDPRLPPERAAGT